MKKNIVFYLPSFVVGGVEIVLYQILNSLAKTNLFNITLILSGYIEKNELFYKLSQIPNLKIIILFKFNTMKPQHKLARRLWKVKKIIFEISSAFKFKALLKKADIIVNFKNASYIEKYKPLPTQKMILWLHCSFRSMKNALKYNHLKNYDSIICLSKAFQKDFIKEFPDFSDKIKVIYNPIDADEIAKKMKDLSELSVTEQKLIKKPFFVHVSRLSTDKDIETLIKAYHLFIKKTKSKTNLLIIGNGPLSNHFKKLSESLKLSQHIFFLGEKNNPFPFIHHAKALILSSKNEGFAYVLLEAMACQTPIICADCPSGPAEILEYGKLGTLFQPQNQQQLAEIMEKYDSAHRDKKLIKLYHNALKQFSPSVINHQIINILMENKTPLVSVNMPVYNTKPDYLRQAIDSMLHQTYQNFELIICDDGSTNQDTLNTLKTIQKENQTDPRLKIFFSSKNKGITPTRNFMLTKSNGKYIALMDSDDISHPKRLEKQVMFLEKNPSVGVCGAQIKIFPSKKEWKNPTKNIDIKRTLLNRCCLACPSVMMRKSLFDNHHIKFENHFMVAQDYRLWSVLIDKTDFYNLPQKLLNYRIENQNISMQKADLCTKETQTIKEDLRKRKLNPKIFNFSPRELQLCLEKKTVKRYRFGTTLIKIIEQPSLKRVYLLGIPIYSKSKKKTIKKG